ncbi:zinc finger protein 462-like isoform X1 [Solea solea]|uniref:zinc finger protein 462-like isoform X1 n=2 Tax=Solea solea TaxID=90069 RepID=UPI00272D1951|nr:zinc finger protein 462-like isoform X1 [Solea solea]
MMHSPADAEDPALYFCKYCTGIFQSQASIYGHLRQVHHISDETEVSDADSQQTHTHSSSFSCQCCDFKAHHCDSLKKHEKQCHKKSKDQTVMGKNIVPEMQQRNMGAVISTSSTSSVTVSKNLKKYKVPSQTQSVSKFFSPASESEVKTSVTLAESSENSKGTLILQESPSSLNSNGVFKVTAKSIIDIDKPPSSHRFLLNDDLFTTELRSATPNDHFEETAPGKSSGKRSSSESPENCTTKKAKSHKDEPDPVVYKLPTPSGTDFLFEMSEDEEENKASVVDGDTNIYQCKHCDYSDDDIGRTAAHYQSYHPYVRHNAIYVQDSRDRSATFRCLECPVEFSSEADLKRHYREEHSEAPEVFTMRSHLLVLKCFVCPLTTDEVNILKEHYKEKHPEHNLNNSLLFCRYSATSRVKTGANEYDTKRSEEISPKNTKTQHEEIRMSPLPLSPMPRGADEVLYHCYNCTFHHKSAVAVHVHYQKNHPGEAVTIDKIKQSSHHISQMRPGPSVREVENFTPQKTVVESSTKDKAVLSQQKVLMSLMKLKHTLVISKTSESSRSEGVTSALEENVKKKEKPLLKSDQPLSTGTNASVSSSADKVFYCQVCSYSNTNIKSVVAHHNTKHVMYGPTGMEEVLWYNTKMQKKKLQRDTEASGTSPSKSVMRQQLTACTEKKEVLNPYECAENLFYCQNCNFGNPTLKGVLNHQIIVHKHINTSRKHVIKYTTVIRKQIQKSKSESKEPSSGLPLPLMSKGDEDQLFCHLCNYRHKTMSNVMTHYFKRHPGFVMNAVQIKEYSITLVSQMQTAQPKEANPASCQDTGNKKNMKTLGKGSSVSTVRAEVPQKSIQCYRCTFSCQQVYLLRRHMWNIHRSNRSAIDLLRTCFRKGMIESGYHCDTCMFSDTDSAVVHKHYQEQHANRKLTLDNITARLYVGPDQRKKLQTKAAAGVTDDDCGSLSQRVGHDETNTFSCRACSFKGDSMLSIMRHCRIVHPWFVKDDGSVPKVITSKKLAASSHVTDEHDTTASFDTYQVPLEFETLSVSSQEATKTVKCPHCAAEFTSQRGLNTHCGLKHQDTVVRNTMQVHIFKCPYCTYVNTIHHGVLTHCQMRHPTSESRSNSVHVDKVYFSSWENCNGKSLGDSARFKGYMCKRCPLICATPEKLKKHMKSKQCVALTNSHKATVQLSAARQFPPSAALRYVSKTSFLAKKKYSKVNCQHCDYTCSTKIALSRHLHVHHREERVFLCALCSCSYNSKKQLGSHYTKSHGRDAFPVHKQVTEPTLKFTGCPLTQQMQHTSKAAMMDNSKISVYKCPRCPYVHTSYHGTLTHCQMKHPTLIARADALTTEEVLVSNMVKCTTGKGSMGRRGYMCRKCPQIHASLPKLKSHNHKHHSLHTTTKPSARNKTKISPQRGATESEAASADLRHQHAAPLSCNVKEMLYKCHMCGYTGLCRKYLQSHYRNKHKLDAVSTSKLLEKYNKYKFQLPKASCDNRALVKCKVCPDMAFDSTQLLVTHYSTFHDWKLDFRVVSRTSKRSTGVYRCCHCRKRINGIRKLCLHLDRHRVWKKKKAAVVMKTATLEITSSEVNEESDAPVFQSVTPMKSFTLTTQTCPRRELPDPELPESELPDPELPESELPESELPESECDAPEHKHTCGQCGRSFMSLKGLRSHERSHAAVAAIQKLDHVTLSALKQNVNEYVVFKCGTLRPFLCSLCSYRTTVLGLWRSHFLKKHLDVIVDVVAADDHKEEPTDQDPDISEENEDEPEAEDDCDTEKSLYLEPPDVQRQLDHYSAVAQTADACKGNVTVNNLLHCEFCNFNTGHMSSVRRHYLNRHGKKILRCKDCDFFTGFRKNLEVHMESGHMTRRSESSLLRCPFCLYQTNKKNHMIDHVDLHRDERVVAVEVRRPKLSRYLQGVVFRCHRCTFSCGNGDSLQAHMKRHDDVRPYRCRLCYYDCTLLSHLEAHLCHKHQIVRNHELVGQVMLDQLEAGVSRSDEEEESLSNKVTVPSDTDDPVTSAGIKKIKDIYVKHEQRVSSPDTEQVHGGNVADAQCDERETSGEDCSVFPLQTEGAAESSEEATDVYREMPVLENELLKEAPLPLQQFKEDEEKDEGIIEDDKNHTQGDGDDNSDHSRLHTCAKNLEALICALCGRKLTSSRELKRHVMRHGI